MKGDGEKMSKSLKNYVTIKVGCLSGPPRSRRVVEAALSRRPTPGARGSSPSWCGRCGHGCTQAPVSMRSRPRAWDHVNSHADCSIPWVGLHVAGVGG